MATHHSLFPTVPWWIIAVIVVILLAIFSGICAGYLCGVCYQLLYEKLRRSKCRVLFPSLLVYMYLQENVQPFCWYFYCSLLLGLDLVYCFHIAAVAGKRNVR